MNCQSGLRISENRLSNNEVGEILEVQAREALACFGFFMKPHKVHEGGLDEDGTNYKGVRLVGNCNNFAPQSYLNPERFNSYLKDFDSSEDSLKLAIASYDVFTKEQTIELERRGIRKVVVGEQILDYAKKPNHRVLQRLKLTMIELGVISEVSTKAVIGFIQRNSHQVYLLIRKSISYILSNVMLKLELLQEKRCLKEPYPKCCSNCLAGTEQNMKLLYSGKYCALLPQQTEYLHLQFPHRRNIHQPLLR